ncbi:MAG: DNA processing protein DprA [Chloroflexi bacterium]|nr:DNA processing protein DprA [Chloroflexota bacterium]
MSKLHWFALSTISGVGGVTTGKLLARFGDVTSIFEASPEALVEIPRVTEKTVAQMQSLDWDELAVQIHDYTKEGIRLISWDEEEYPVNLRQISSAPPLLFVRGEILPGDEAAVAIVGTRKATPKSLKLARALGKEMAERGLTVVSGLAIGIDTAAHRGALESAEGRTLAVLGSGLKAIHPKRNLPLAETITQRGAVLSELRPDTRVRGPQLMARDRITSGLAKGVIVVEAQVESGSTDTAKRAQRQGRLLLAVPGSPGNDALIAEGAAESLSPVTLDLDDLAARIRTHRFPQEPEQMAMF